MRYHRILVPVDGSATAGTALAAAIELAQRDGSRMRLLHAVDELALVSGAEDAGLLARLAREHGHRVLREALAAATAAGVQADVRLIEAPAQRLGQTVAAEAHDWPADLVVVGSRGRRGIGRVLLGSGAESIIRLAQVPVLVIRGSGD
jgi:nucleotide-binding universal stress UspA family protein